MALILLPISLHENTSSEILENVLEDFLEHLRSQDPLAQEANFNLDLGGSALQRVQIVPWRVKNWRKDRWKRWKHRNILHATETSITSDETEYFRTRLQKALSYAIQLLSHYRIRTERIIIVPIFVSLKTEYDKKHLEVLKDIQEQIDIITKDIFFKHLRMSSDPIDLPINIEYYPWLYLQTPPRIENLPTYIFQIPSSFRIDPTKRGTHPWLYTSRSSTGEYRSWEEYGASRLLSDLYFFYANVEIDIIGSLLSSEKIISPIRLEPYDPRKERKFVIGHSSIFEFPLHDILRQKRLEYILLSNEQKSLLPNGQELISLIAACRKSAQQDVQNLLASLKVHYSLKPDSDLPPEMKQRLEFGSHHDDPDFERMFKKPNTERWQNIITEDWPILHTNLSMSHLFDEIHKALQRRSKENLDTHLERELKETRIAIEKETQKIQDDLQNILLRPYSKEIHEKREEHLRKNIGQTFAYLQLIIENLESFNDGWETLDEQKMDDDPEAYLDSLIEYREKWITQEIKLWEAGKAQPSYGAIWIDMIGTAVAMLAIGTALPIYLAIFGIPIAFVIGVFLFRVRQKQRKQALEKYFTQWEELQERVKEEANDIAFSFGRKVLRRTFQLKIMLLQDLLSGLRSATRRFQVELNGFTRLVSDEQARLSLRFREIKQNTKELEQGRFVFLPPKELFGVLDTSEAIDDKISKQITMIFKDSISIGRIPQVTSIEKHEEVLLRLSQLGRPNLDMLQLPAAEKFAQAKEFTFSSDASYLGFANTITRNQAQFQILGEAIARRLRFHDNNYQDLKNQELETRETPLQILSSTLHQKRPPRNNSTQRALYIFPTEIALSYHLNQYTFTIKEKS